MPTFWPYALGIRIKAPGGGVYRTFTAGTWYGGVGGAQSVGTAVDASGAMIAPTVLGPPTYEKVELVREKLDWTNDPITVGWRPKLHVEWLQLHTEIVGQFGSGSYPLATVVGALSTPGYYLEVSLDLFSTPPHYRACNLVSQSYEYKNVDGKDIGVTLALDFEGKALISGPPPVDAVSWGMAT